MKTLIWLSGIMILAQCLMSHVSRADFVITGNVADGSGVFSITQDIDFEITVAGNAGAIVLDDWIPAGDGFTAGAVFSPDSLTVAVNDVDTTFSGNVLGDDASGFAINDLEANDTYFFWDNASGNGPAVNPGDILTIRAGSWSLPAIPVFNPGVTGRFMGNAFVLDANANRISNLTIAFVPEPSTMATTSVAILIGTCFTRRRRTRAE